MYLKFNIGEEVVFTDNKKVVYKVVGAEVTSCNIYYNVQYNDGYVTTFVESNLEKYLPPLKREYKVNHIQVNAHVEVDEKNECINYTNNAEYVIKIKPPKDDPNLLQYPGPYKITIEQYNP